MPISKSLSIGVSVHVTERDPTPPFSRIRSRHRFGDVAPQIAYLCDRHRRKAHILRAGVRTVREVRAFVEDFPAGVANVFLLVGMDEDTPRMASLKVVFIDSKVAG